MASQVPMPPPGFWDAPARNNGLRNGADFIAEGRDAADAATRVAAFILIPAAVALGWYLQ